MGNVFKNVAVGIAIVAVLQTFGALFELFYRRFVNPSLIVASLSWALVVALALVGRYRATYPYRRHTAVVAASSVLYVVLAAVGVSAISLGHYHYIPSFDLWTYPPNSTIEDCWKGRGCHEYAINPYGFRGPAPSQDAKILKLALLGDSWVFCSGVDDGETLAETLDARLDSGLDHPVEVVSAALPGRSIDSFLRQARYAEKVYDPDAYVVLLKPDDKNTLDLNQRLKKAAALQTYGFLVGLNFEFMYNYLTQFGGALRQYDPQEMVAKLDALYQSVGHKKILLVTSLRNDYRATVSAWAGSKPTVMHLDVLNDGDWKQAARIVNDEHWSEEGVETIADILNPFVARLMTSDGPFLTTLGKTQPSSAEVDERPLKNLDTLLGCLKTAGVGGAIIDEASKTVRINVDPTRPDGPRLNAFCCVEGDYYARIGNLCFAVAKSLDATFADNDLIKRFIDTNTPAIRKACTYGSPVVEASLRVGKPAKKTK